MLRFAIIVGHHRHFIAIFAITFITCTLPIQAIACTGLTISGGNLTANSSTITVNGDIQIANLANLFTRGTSTVVLGATGNISNPDWQSAFHNLTQNNGITTTLTGYIRTYGALTTGDASSTILADGSNRTT